MKAIFFSNKYFLFAIMIIIFSVTSCEKVVTIDLKNTTAQIVVQGNVTSLPGPYTVSLNSSISYYGDNNFPAITGAQIKISDNSGNSDILTETANGIYKTDSISGIPGRMYNLQITTNGVNYNASGIMHDPLPIDSFLLRPSIGRGGNPMPGYMVVCKFTDPGGVGNFYRMTVSSRDTAAIGDNKSRIVSDKLTDGQQLSVTFRTKLLIGDTVSVQLQSIDKGTYDFYNTLGGAVGDAGTRQFLAALPANPISNISNKGLGYFAAYAVTTKTMVVH